MKLSVEPKLPAQDRKHLSAFMQTLKRERPSYIYAGASFQYRGSTVKIVQV